jgi:hypothetical protein
MCVINFNALASVESIVDNKMVPQRGEKRQPGNHDVDNNKYKIGQERLCEREIRGKNMGILQTLNHDYFSNRLP